MRIHNDEKPFEYSECDFKCTTSGQLKKHMRTHTGHDEFMYMALKESVHNLPEWATYVVRFHSFYPWHDKGAYAKYASRKDWDNLK